MVDKAEIQGSFTPPPPEAPQEKTAPGSERPTPEQLAAARANERPQAPFAPEARPMTVEQQAAFLGKSVDEIRAMRAAAGLPVDDAGDVPARSAQAARALPTPVAASAPPPRTADHALSGPPAELPVGTVLGADGKPMIRGTKGVDTPIVKRRAGLRVVHKKAPVESAAEPTAAPVGGEGAAAVPAGPTPVVSADAAPSPSAPSDALPDRETLDQKIAELNQVTREAIAREDARLTARADATAPPSPEPAPLPEVQPAQPHQPAASNSDSPSRGVPQPIDDPGKKITGGFGHAGEAQYFPLDGSELRELIYALLGNIHDRLQDDLRFTHAITYPRCTARVLVEVDAFGMDETMRIEKRAVPHEKTPIEVARSLSDEIVFVVKAERGEMTEEGESIAPPDATRRELNLPVPRKTAVQTPGGRMLVDVKQ